MWNSILEKGGSVQHLDFLTPEEKDVFKTSFEIDQRWLLELAADRTPFIDQAQSLNLFIPADVDKWDLMMLHFRAWELGIKSLYYLRSQVGPARRVSPAGSRPTTPPTCARSRSARPPTMTSASHAECRRPKSMRLRPAGIRLLFCRRGCGGTHRLSRDERRLRTRRPADEPAVFIGFWVLVCPRRSR